MLAHIIIVIVTTNHAGGYKAPHRAPVTEDGGGLQKRS
jgi:hypothetical protein